MPMNITVTKREVKNRTGVDISVTSYDSAPTPKQVKNYHVVVITRLPFFKLGEHSEEDVVQFMVRREYSAFENLQRDILQAFPELKLPAFPRKYHVFMNETDIEERMVSFDCIVKLIARDKTMCTSSPMLQFLGFDTLSDRKYYKARREVLQKKEEDDVNLRKKNKEVYGDRLEETGLEFFGTGNEEVFSDDSTQTKTQPFTGDSIFEENEKEKAARKSAKISVLKDEHLLFQNREKPDSDSQANQSSLLEKLEDNSELLNVMDSLDDVLKIADKKKSPAKKVSPLSSSGAAKGLFEVEEETDDGVADMGGDDIMKYIQQSQASNDDDLDLF